MRTQTSATDSTFSSHRLLSLKLAVHDGVVQWPFQRREDSHENTLPQKGGPNPIEPTGTYHSGFLGDG